MNPKLEKCVACDQQCTLKQNSASLVERARSQSLTTQQLREGVSRISQNAYGIGCPSSEIIRVRQETVDQIDPKRSNTERVSLRAFGIRDSMALPFYEPQSDGPYVEKGNGSRSPRR